ncbi:hypothetical protein [Pseudonocardia sp. GCM10023141]|uniref:hypothetical protein n=1 Tax=Pseudonocardia sp. GCM10023141 TaxID=3252653 RepID=UPI0036152C97
MGLLRRPLLVPRWAAASTGGDAAAAAGARDAFGTANRILGNLLAGVLSPLELPLTDAANFIGYILWSAWLVIFAVELVVRRRRALPAAHDAAQGGAHSLAP